MMIVGHFSGGAGSGRLTPSGGNKDRMFLSLHTRFSFVSWTTCRCAVRHVGTVAGAVCICLGTLT